MKFRCARLRANARNGSGEQGRLHPLFGTVTHPCAIKRPLVTNVHMQTRLLHARVPIVMRGCPPQSVSMTLFLVHSCASLQLGGGTCLPVLVPRNSRACCKCSIELYSVTVSVTSVCGTVERSAAHWQFRRITYLGNHFLFNWPLLADVTARCRIRPGLTRSTGSQ